MYLILLITRLMIEYHNNINFIFMPVEFKEASNGLRSGFNDLVELGKPSRKKKN